MAISTSSPVPTRYRFSVDDFHRMGEVGIFGEDDRVELVDGEIVAMTPIGAQHARCVNRLNRRLVLALAEEAIVSVQNPIVLGTHDEPQPDVAVLRPRAEEQAGNPGADDVLLVVEVADSSLAYDRDAKLPRYGRSGIPETWIVDLTNRTLTRYTEPTPEGYRVATVFRPGEVVTSTALPALQVRVDDILP